MTTSETTQRQSIGAHRDAPAENLLFTEYRCWMAGFETRDVSCWEIAWGALAATLPLRAARLLFGDFHCFARSIREHATREVGWRPAACRCLCRDECIVLALVEASQRDRARGERIFASSLLGHARAEPLIEASRSLARSLAEHGLVLRPLTPFAHDLAATIGTPPKMSVH